MAHWRLIEWRKPLGYASGRTAAALGIALLYSFGGVAPLAATGKAKRGIRFIPLAERLPIWFEKNEGQFSPKVKFAARGSGYAALLTNDGAVLEFRRPQPEDHGQIWPSRPSPFQAGPPNPPVRREFPHEDVFQLIWLGAGPSVKVTPMGELPGKVNYLTGSDRKKWLTNVPLFSRIRYRSVYPGIGLVFYGNRRRLEYDFVVAPGADPNLIRLGIRARHAKVAKAANGDLIVRINGRSVRFAKPTVYQPGAADLVLSKGRRRFLDGRYILLPDHQVAFKIAPYDHSKPLVIDPVLDYSTYFGGTGFDYAKAIAVDSAGNAYIAGYTTSTDLPTSAPLQAGYGGGSCNNDMSPSPCFDAFVAKFSPKGDGLVYATYLGGSSDDRATAIAVDSQGEAFVAGYTGSADFPTSSAYQASIGGGTCGSSTNPYPCYDAFVTRLSASGSSLVYSTFLGGGGDDYGTGLAVDSSLNAYITGFTSGGNFPVTDGAMQGAFAGGPDDSFVAKFAANGATLDYSTLLGGSGEDRAAAIAVDFSGDAYVTGQTNSPNFPLRLAFQSVYSGGALERFDAFVTKLNAAGSSTVYSTYLGGQGGDYGDAIALDSSGEAFIAGWTTSADFPVSKGAYQVVYGGSDDAFVAKLSVGGNSLVYATFLGGLDPEVANGIALDNSGDAFVIGSAYGVGFPAASPLQSANGGFYDAWLASLNPAGSSLLYATWLGGTGDDYGNAVAVDTSKNVYIAGGTFSTDFPTTPGSFATAYGGGGYDAFAAKVSSASDPGASLMPDPLTFDNQEVGVPGSAQNVKLMNAGSAVLDISGIEATGHFSETSTCGSILAPGASCAIAVTFTPQATGAVSGKLSVWDNAAGSPQTESLMGTGSNSGSLPAVAMAPASLDFGKQTVGTPSAPKIVTVTNTGAATLNVGSIAVDADFSETTDCGASLAPGQSCSVSVAFTPTTEGTLTGWLTLTDNAPDSPQKVSLSGTGVATFALSAVSNTQIIIRGTNQASFVISASDPPGFTGTISLACSESGGATCSFNPPAIQGGQSSALAVSGLSSVDADSIALTVMGTDGSQSASVALSVEFGDFTLAASPSASTVSPGETVDYTLTLNPLNGFDFPVSVSCAGAPAGATCTLSPSTVTPNGASAATIDVTIDTAMGSSAFLHRGDWKDPSPGRIMVRTGLFLALLGLVIMAGSRHSNLLTIHRAGKVISVALITFALSSCGGGGSGAPSSPGQNPTQAYTIALRAQAGPLTRTAKVTLNLN